MTSNEAIIRLFTYHAPFGDQPGRYESIRSLARDLGLGINSLCPESPEKTQAILLLQQAVMMANASIAINEHTELTPAAIDLTRGGGEA